jgi:16S rRNA (cytosine1402-N4)-methyltransferase
MSTKVAGDLTPHTPVLYNEIILAIQPKSQGLYIDGTVGAGGHAFGLLEASHPDGQLLALDVDPQALAIARQRLSPFGERVTLVQASYTTLEEQMRMKGWSAVNGLVLDLGLSSMQLDSPERGFSFQVDGPLDMRFNPQQTLSAAGLVNDLPESELANLIWRTGEEPHSRKIARAIVNSRPISTTRQLAELISKVSGGQRGKIHPATRTFQALRIAVNEELQAVAAVLPKALNAMMPGGRTAIIAFHSLEDRLVKQFIQRESQDCICPPEQPVCTCNHTAALKNITRHAIKASEAEIATNSRARSARLRVFEKV